MNKDKEKQNLVWSVERMGKEIHIFFPGYLKIEEVYLYKNDKKFVFTLENGIPTNNSL